MKLNVSNRFIQLVEDSYKQVRWRVFLRKTNTLSASIVGYTNWIEITDRILEMSDIKSSIEFEFGQFRIDNIEITASGIKWFNDNVFNLNQGEYLELKVEFQIGVNNIYCDDILYMFWGVVDMDKSFNKIKYTYNENNDTVSFVAYTVEDIGTRIAAEYITTRYNKIDPYTGNVIGCILFNNDNIWVTNVNISGYALPVGVYNITYDYNNGNRRIKFENGRWVSINNNATEYTLGNAANAADDKLRIKVYVWNINMLPISVLTTKIVVLSSGDNLPYQFYNYVSGYRLLEIIYSRLGITNLLFDTLNINTFDNRKIISYIDKPPADESVVGNIYAITNDGSNLFIGVGNKIYKRDMLNNKYVLIYTISGDYVILKMFYNERNNHLWVMYSLDGDVYDSKMLLLSLYYYDDYDVIFDVVMGSDCHPCNVELFDYCYDGNNYKYGVIYKCIGKLIWIDENGNLNKLVESSDIVESFGYKFNSNTYHYEIYSSGNTHVYSYYINNSGNWVSGGYITSRNNMYYKAIFNPNDNCIYGNIDNIVIRQLYNSSSSTILSSNYYINGMVLTSSGIMCSAINTTNKNNEFLLLTNSISVLDNIDVSFGSSNESATILNGVYYGISNTGILFQYNNKINFYVKNADFEGMSITQALHQILKAFMLIAKVSHIKKAYCYRRCDDSGNVVTSGNYANINISNAGEITRNSVKYEKCALVKVRGENNSETYNGVSFSSNVLSDERVFEINNKYIPDKILKDIAYYIYQFVKTARDTYQIKLNQVPLFQFEPFDGANINISGKLQLNLSGIIISMVYKMDGTTIMEVLV